MKYYQKRHLSSRYQGNFMDISDFESEYPTNQQIEECFKAHEENGESGILEFLKRQRAEREKAASIRPTSEHDDARRKD